MEERGACFSEDPAQLMAEAMHRLASDDGYTTGVLFAGNRPAFMPKRKNTTSIADIEKKFLS